jgi:dTDP-glucose 4,6-dehydratase|tara:strand:+ start:2189 stop:3181 length:993 start_codon:yes stop_codon:yes gene_type:complete
MSKTVVITGGAGFIGHHIVEGILKDTDWNIFVLDKLTYAARGLDRLRDIEAYDDKRVTTLVSDFTHPISEGVSREIGTDVDYILHLGAETHVDNSIDDPEPFVRSNVLGTMHMLNYARTLPNLKWFLYFSTDEVFGSAPPGVNYKEWDRYDSGNPYSAAKAGGEELALAYANTYGVPTLITHTMNVFGERQHPEKFIPLVLRKVLNGETIKIHSNSNRDKAGSRFWIHGRNVWSAVYFLLNNGEQREKYNIVGEREIDNLEMAQIIAGIIGKELKYEMVDFHTSRPGHDLRYALDGGKMDEMGWKLPVNFEESLRKTIEWTKEHPEWINL